MTPTPTPDAPVESQTEEVSAELQEKFASILRDNGIMEEVESITMVHPEFLKGEHMATATVYVTIHFKDGKRKQKNLFVKKFTHNEMFAKVSKDMKIMDKEAEFFNNFLPAAREFCSKFEGCDDLLYFFPTCLYGDQNMVVLENHVLDDDYVMIPKEDLQDFETAKRVLKNLARFHGVTFSVVEEAGGRDAFRSRWGLVCHEPMMSHDNPFCKGMFDNGLSTCVTIMKGVSLPDSEETIQKVGAMIGNTFDGLMKCLEVSSEDKLVLVNHGDCWNNNMLFKVDLDSDGKRIVTEHMFVDLQITRLTSPCIDLCYFMHTSVKPEVRRNKLKELLTLYFDTFCATLARFGNKCPVSFDELFKDYKNRVYYGYLANLNFVAMMGALKELSFDDIGGTTPEEMVEGFNKIMNEWIAKNPEKSKKMAQEMIDVVKEYENLMAS